jgi:hypothetical protein
MTPFDDFQRHANRRARLLATAALTIAIAPSPARADRADDFERMEAEFESATEEFVETHRKENPIVQKHINGSYFEEAVAELLDKTKGKENSNSAALGKSKSGEANHPPID